MHNPRKRYNWIRIPMAIAVAVFSIISGWSAAMITINAIQVYDGIVIVNPRLAWWTVFMIVASVVGNMFSIALAWRIVSEWKGDYEDKQREADQAFRSAIWESVRATEASDHIRRSSREAGRTT